MASLLTTGSHGEDPRIGREGLWSLRQEGMVLRVGLWEER